MMGRVLKRKRPSLNLTVSLKQPTKLSFLFVSSICCLPWEAGFRLGL